MTDDTLRQKVWQEVRAAVGSITPAMTWRDRNDVADEATDAIMQHVQAFSRGEGGKDAVSDL